MHATAADALNRLFASEASANANPYPLYRELREAGQCHSATDPWGGKSWHLTRYADIAPALRDLRLSSKSLIHSPETAQEPAGDLERLYSHLANGSLLTADPPDHTRLRKLVTPGFTPKQIQALRPQIQEIVDDLLATAAGKGETDFIADFADRLPLMAIALLMGVPQEDWRRLHHLSNGLFDVQPSRQTLLHVEELDAYLRELAATRRGKPQNDLISALVHAHDDAEALTDDELISQLFMLLTGGIETTSAGLGNGLLSLLQRPDIWRQLEMQPIDGVIEELLRFESPFQYTVRRALVDLELGAQRIKAGDMVWLWLGSANRDPEVFARPDELDLARSHNKHVSHLAFGMGIHYCLGAPLARLEMQIALTTLRQYYPDMRLTQEEVRWRKNSVVRGLETLPVALA